MRRLTHASPEEEARPRGRAKLSFRAAAASLALTMGIGCASTLNWNYYYDHFNSSTTGEYGARDVRELREGRWRLEIMFLMGDATIGKLENSTAPFRIRNPPVAPGQIAEMVSYPGVVFRRVYDPARHSVQETTGTASFAYVITRGDAGAEHNAGIFFPSTIDSAGASEAVAGARDLPARDFSEMFRELTGRELERVRILIERHTEYFTGHIIGVGADGSPAGSYRGGQLCLGFTYYPQRNEVRSALGIIVEPDGPDPVTGVPPARYQR
jgi:hypothetical protein